MFVLPVLSNNKDVSKWGHSSSKATHISLKALKPFLDKISTNNSALALTFCSTISWRSSSALNTPFLVNWAIKPDWEGSSSLDICSLWRSKSFWMLFLEPAILMKNLGGSELFDIFQIYYIVLLSLKKRGKIIFSTFLVVKLKSILIWFDWLTDTFFAIELFSFFSILKFAKIVSQFRNCYLLGLVTLNEKKILLLNLRQFNLEHQSVNDFVENFQTIRHH